MGTRGKPGVLGEGEGLERANRKKKIEGKISKIGEKMHFSFNWNSIGTDSKPLKKKQKIGKITKNRRLS